MKNLTICSLSFLLVSVTTLFAITPRSIDASPVVIQEPGSNVPDWTVDTVHSCAMFRVRHMGAGFFWGRFNDVSGTIAFNPEDAKSLGMDITIDVDSVDSGHPDLDKHLKSPDFFDAKEFPKITFKSTSVKQVPTTKRSDDPVIAWDVTGTFSMHGVSKELTARVHYWGAADMGRGTKAGFEATFNVKRSEFEINYGIEQGALGDMVTVTAAFEVAAAK
jgi:polyisoprenoid-binding protein YceI